MPSVNSLITQLKLDYPEFSFEPSDHFRWSLSLQTVFFDPQSKEAEAFCLHELSHAILKHHAYAHDIDLLKLERDAWEYAENTLAGKYKMVINDEVIQDNLDTYREWLHARSTCPQCKATGIQSSKNSYHCVGCGQNWRVNEAKLCGLKRYTIAK